MKTIRFNGEFWYEDTRSLAKRVAEWIVWVGGWSTFRKFSLGFRLRHLTPVSIVGHRTTFYGHWFDVKTPEGVLVVNLRERYAFISRDGTPGRAHLWLYGAPREIREAAERRVARVEANRDN
jgi:hypothetical protein